MSVNKLVRVSEHMACALREIVRACEGSGNNMNSYKQLISDYEAARKDIECAEPEFEYFADETCAEVPAFARRQND